MYFFPLLHISYLSVHLSLCFFASIPISCLRLSLCFFASVPMLLALIRSCSRCRWRKGRSAFRQSSRQSGTQINALYDIYNLNTGHSRTLAAQKLTRWGFNPKRRCALPTVCRHLLVRTPNHKDELFPAVDYRDRLHGLVVFLHRTLYEPFSRMGLPRQVSRILDQRLTEVGLQRSMRNPNTGRAYRVQRSLFKDTNMSGHDRAHWIFYVPHVIGHNAICLPDVLRDPVLEAFALAQVMIIAAHGRRSYNKSELQLIFDRGFISFFTAMERIHQINHDRLYDKKLTAHRRNPEKFAAPKRFTQKDT